MLGVHDGPHEVLKGIDRSLGNLIDLLDEDVLEATLGLPEGAGDVKASESRALLTLVLEGSANGLDGGGTNVGRGVDELPVLSSSLSDHARVAEVLVHVLSDRLPERFEDVSRSGEVEAGEVLVGDGAVDELDGVVSVGAGKELDHVLGETSLEEDLEDDPRSVGGGGRGLPEDDVSDEGGDSDEVTSNGGEAVEESN